MLLQKNDYKDRGCDIAADEIFVSDGAKCDSGNIQEIFGLDNKIAVCDPVYPVYVDSNVMAGRAGDYDAATERFTNVIYMPCTAENNFTPELPKETPDLIYLCFPNNPTGAMVSKAELQKWVDYANKVGAIICMMLHTRHISQKKTFRIPSMSARVQEHVPSKCAASPRTQALPVCVLDSPLSRKTSNPAM